jgi:acyl-CoA thioesterase
MSPAAPSFDADTTPAADGSVELAERWNVGRNQNGGVLLATVARRMAEVAGHPDPFAVTGHFLGAATNGPASIQASVVKPGRTYATATGELWQDDRERVRAVGAFGDLAVRAAEGASPIVAAPPDLPPPDACDDLFDHLTAKVGERSLTKSLRNFEIRVPADEPWLRAELRTRSIVGGLLDEDGELWSAEGALVARFRQLALLLPRD